MLKSSAMLKAFKMPFLRNARKGSSQKPAQPATPDDYRARLERFKSMLQKMQAVDPSEFYKAGLRGTGAVTNKQMQKVLADYAKNGRALWDYARAVTREMSEAERQLELNEIKSLLARAGFDVYATG
jgi:hypothetical protein